MAEPIQQRHQLVMIFHPKSEDASLERLDKLAGIGKLIRPVEFTRVLADDELSS